MTYRLLHADDLKDLLSMEHAIEAVGTAYGAVADFPVAGARSTTARWRAPR